MMSTIDWKKSRRNGTDTAIVSAEDDVATPRADIYIYEKNRDLAVVSL